MLELTNENVRRRYLDEKARSVALNRPAFTYASVAALFEVDERTVYTWLTENKALQHLPSNLARKNKLIAWINDGSLE